MVREVLEVPIVGTVPAIKPAAALTKTGVIGLLGTAATIRQAYVDDLEAEFAQGKRLLRHAAPSWSMRPKRKLRGETPDPAVFAALQPRACASSPAASGSTPWCSPAPTSRCSRRNWRAAFGPGVALRPRRRGHCPAHRRL